jgi:hypothetical protein
MQAAEKINETATRQVIDDVNLSFNKKKSDFFLPFSIIKELKFDFFMTFLSSIVFGQIAVIISIILSVVYFKATYLYSILKNGDLLSISMAFLGTYFAFLIMEFRDEKKIFLRDIKVFIISLSILIATIMIILLVIIKLDSDLYMNWGLILMQVVLAFITLFISVYSICLINLDRYNEKTERNSKAEKYLEDEDKKIGDMKKNASKENVTSEGDKI